MLFLPYLLHCRCDVGLDLVWISGTALGVDLVKRLEETLFRCRITLTTTDSGNHCHHGIGPSNSRTMRCGSSLSTKSSLDNRHVSTGESVDGGNARSIRRVLWVRHAGP